MEEKPGLFHETVVLSDIWSEAYRDWVDDWNDAYRKEGEKSLSCCRSELAQGRILFPIDIS